MRGCRPAVDGAIHFPCERVLSSLETTMLRIEGNKGGRWIARIAVAAAMALCVANPASARRQGVTTWTVTGPQGGPFTPTSGSVKITNTFSQKLRWWATGDTSWVDVQNTGIVLPGQSKTLSLQLIHTAATSKPKGTYKAQIAFRDPSSGAYSGVADLVLVVGDPPPSSGKLEVTPPEGLVSTGNQGSTFAPLAKDYTLKNSGSASVSWRVSFDDPWAFSPDPIVGQLQPGASAVVSVELDPAQLASFPVGQHATRVRFWDSGLNLEVASRELRVDVKSVSSGAGWTQFNASPDTRIVYVSSSGGNDANNGLSEATPKKSLSAGKSLLRSGYPDWLLLKKGDVWQGQDLGQIGKSGRSVAEPMLISSYGSGARPQIRPTSGNSGVQHFSGTLRYLAFADLHIEPTNPVATSGNAFALFAPVEHVLVEGCYMSGFHTDIVLSNGCKSVSFRRNVIVDAWVNHILAGGGVTDLLLEENVFQKSGLQNTFYNHSIYIANDDVSGVTVRGNIVADAHSSGLECRPGGIAENNLFLRCPVGIVLGGGYEWEYFPDGVTGTLRRNVILDGVDMPNGGGARGWGFHLENVGSALVESNLVANCGPANQREAFGLEGRFNGAQVYNVTLRKNVVSGWGGPGVNIHGLAGSQVKNIVMDDNDLQNLLDASYLVESEFDVASGEISSMANQFFAGQLLTNSWFLLSGQNQSFSGYKTIVGDTTSTNLKASYPNAQANISSYNQSIGGTASHAAFMAEARKQSRDNWRTEYTAEAVNAWMRASFGM
jgi:hypothetical protein